MTTTSEATEQERPRGPRRREEQMYGLALSLGRANGGQYPWIWDSPDEIAENVYARTKPSILQIGGAVPTRTVYRVVTWVAFFLLVASIGGLWMWLSGIPMDARPGHVGWLLLPLALVIVWGLTYFVGRGILDSAVRNRVARLDWLADVACLTAFEGIKERQATAYEYKPGASGEAFEPKGPAPLPQPYGASDAGAAELAASWMRFLGAGDAHSIDPKTGTNAQSTHYVTRVDTAVDLTEVPSVRELAGGAAVAKRRALFFSAAGFTDEARQFADRADIALFVFDATAGNLTGANFLGEAVFRTGL
ncbi:hypothetical protein E3O44_06295 [Cryobacterium algoricola]|uniref:Restriction endonuclease n=1 Tax=Cryobacterium algoricola TaxID=1259183 RepID=A0ABY2IH55_9MICO|nr:hypothetical protein [Cryobacterium algoricola]TFB88273.1 hypothetical protein E3O44_06295 [Cryobacterium algoricola]